MFALRALFAALLLARSVRPDSDIARRMVLVTMIETRDVLVDSLVGRGVALTCNMAPTATA